MQPQFSFKDFQKNPYLLFKKMHEISLLGAIEKHQLKIFKIKSINDNITFWCHLVYDKRNPYELRPDAKHVIHS